MNDFGYWLLREYGQVGSIIHIRSTQLEIESGNEILDQEEHEVKMVLLPVTVVRTYSQQLRGASDYGNIYAQGNSIVVLPVPTFQVDQDDIVHVNGFILKIIDKQYLHHEGLLELVVRA